MGIEHNTFICWSGEPSRHIARALRQWLPVVVQKSRPWMSEEDIGKGSSHFSEITQSLRQTRVGIICLTPQNLHSTWIHFEAGAIFNAIEGQHGVCTYLIGGIQPKDLFPPLNQFQATVSTKEDTRRLVKTVHKTLGSTVEDETLEMAFEANWPRMQAELKSLPPAPAILPALTREEMDQYLERLSLFVRGGEKETLREIVKGIESNPAVLSLKKPFDLGGGNKAIAPEDWADARAWELIKQMAASK